ncbi:unnamed protein product [Chrysodeixis includens]|uniref:SHOCT domain-containing protein n=1 Tax=Chrysodeixis includens TaxID=689277 RepID=A0A9N8L4V1_CHRIL|nr:unnamed protein product [Chrysodeixis includens]
MASSSYGLNAGFIAGDLKRLSPLVIKKFSQNSPVFINTKQDNHMRSMIDQATDKALIKKRSIIPAPPLKVAPKHRRSISTIPKLPYVPLLLPWMPKHPFVSIFPGWLPTPTSAPYPLAPPLARVSTLSFLDRRNSEILTRLNKLRSKGSLTSSEYMNFKKLLF